MNRLLDVWLISCAGECNAESARILSPEECRRADSFVFGEDRSRFIQAHAALRQILGSYTHLPAKSLRFGCGKSGKPFLEGAGRSLSFNLSHSSDLAVVAVGAMPEIGVDVERVRGVVEWMDISRNTFHPAENEWVLSQALDRRSEAFFQVWTAKEAYVKASGLGFGHPLESFSVLATEPPENYIITRLDVPSGYAGAVAHPPPPCEIRLNWWRPGAGGQL